MSNTVKKNTIVRLVIVVLVILGTVWLIFSLCSMDLNQYIFSEIKECTAIETWDAKATVTVLETPNSDKNLRDLPYKIFYGAEYESDEMEFTIYAYEFESKEDAQAYFEKATGKNNAELDTNYSASTGLGRYRVVVIDGENAYMLYSNSRYKDEVKALLSHIFSKKI